MADTYCSSCGLPIPEGQGKSCSMCYGDIGHGKDGYYQRWADEQLEKEEFERQFTEWQGDSDGTVGVD